MTRLSACYFCGTALDEPLVDYQIAADAPADDAAAVTVTLCETCQEKLERVLTAADDTAQRTRRSRAAGGQTGSSASTAGDPAPASETDPDDVLVDPGPSDSRQEPETPAPDETTTVAPDDTTATAPDDATNATPDEATTVTPDDATTAASGGSEDAGGAGDTSGTSSGRNGEPASKPESEPGSKPDSEPAPAGDGAGGTGADDARPGGAGAGSPDTDATAPSDAAESSTSTDPTKRSVVEGEHSVSALEYNKVMRLLQNREFPIDREEIVTVATNAYGLGRSECATVIDVAIDRGLVEEADGQLRRPDSA